ncbi:unannotated protein [freshwater metagenome]|uniref:Unannotated protein n=1 Tax=freshwater metagenome TaxID=449393 RepID=A0A6J7I060_9ZZZZ|nr:competence/damage-inducible protein A [Actinomycetota bacterium]
MSARAGILVTGTEVLTGRVTDRNGPWLAERLREIGVDIEAIVVVGDRPQDMAAALGWLAAEGVDLIVTSGGLGPTADDLTAEVVGGFQGREMVLDEALRGRIAAILERLARRWKDLDLNALEDGNRKQATIPAGATILEPIGTAPGLVVPPASGEGPTIVVLPGPPSELQPMWHASVATEALRAATRSASPIEQRMLRLFGIPESELAESLRRAEEGGPSLERLEITTCMRRAELEVVTRFDPAATEDYQAFATFLGERHADTLFSDDESSVDEQVAALLLRAPRQTLAVAESCTGGLVAGRITDLAGSSAYFRGGLVVYSNDAKVTQAGVPVELLEEFGAVSREVAMALADGAAARLGADVGLGITGIAGPGGGTEEKPTGTVWLSACRSDGVRLEQTITMPGDRANVRDRTTTFALHLLRRLLLAPS